MNVLLVFAHPEPRSLNGSLRNFAVKRLQDHGHVVKVSDLYAMQWKAALDANDDTAHVPGERFDASKGSRKAFDHGSQSPDIALEQDKLRWADALILQFSWRGINGSIDDLLFPIQHGILFYPGLDVVPPFVTYRTGRMDETGFSQACDELGRRLDTLWTTDPIAFRPQNSGAYAIPELTLRPELASGRHGLDIHIE